MKILSEHLSVPLSVVRLVSRLVQWHQIYYCPPFPLPNHLCYYPHFLLAFLSFICSLLFILFTVYCFSELVLELLFEEACRFCRLKEERSLHAESQMIPQIF